MYTKKNNYDDFVLPPISERILSGRNAAGSKLTDEPRGRYVSDQENINAAMPYLRQAAGEMYDSQHNEERSVQELAQELMMPEYIPAFDAAMPNKTDPSSLTATSPLLQNVQQSTSLPGMSTMQFVPDEQKAPSVSLLPNGSGAVSPKTGPYIPSGQMQVQNLPTQTGSASSPTPNSLSISGNMPGGIASGNATAVDYQDSDTPTELYSTETPDMTAPVQENEKTFAPAKEHHLVWWVYRDESKYDINDVNDMISVLTTLSNDINDELKANTEKYMTKGAIQATYNKRIEQIDKLLPQLKWYLNNLDQYIEEDGKLTKEQVQEQINEIYVKLIISKYLMDEDTKYRYQFSSEIDWYVATFPDKAKEEMRTLTEKAQNLRDGIKKSDEMIKELNGVFCPEYVSIDIVEKCIDFHEEERDKLASQLKPTEERLSALGKSLSEYYTNALTEHYQKEWKEKGRTLEDIRSDKKKATDKKSLTEFEIEEKLYLSCYYDGLKNNPDFEQNCHYKKTSQFGKVKKVITNIGDGYDIYYVVNTADPKKLPKNFLGYLEKYTYMSEDEKKIYNYLFNTQGIKEANKYAEYMANGQFLSVDGNGNVVFVNDNLTQRWAVADASDDKLYEKMKKSVSADFYKTLIGLYELLGGDKMTNPKEIYMQEYYRANSSEFENFVLDFTSDAADIGTKWLVSLIPIYGPALSIAMGAIGGAGAAYYEALDNGFDNATATKYATLVGSIKGFTGMISNALSSGNFSKSNLVERLIIFDDATKKVASKIGDYCANWLVNHSEDLMIELVEEYVLNEKISTDNGELYDAIMQFFEESLPEYK